jgi:hypothetical protein
VIRHSSLEQLQKTDAFVSNESNQTRFRHGSCFTSAAAASPSRRHSWNTSRRAATAGQQEREIHELLAAHQNLQLQKTPEGKGGIGTVGGIGGRLLLL